jgi:Putative salt-induced outer membrane protein
MKTPSLFLLMSALSMPYSHAAEADSSPWQSELSLGLQQLSGNADSQTVNGEVNGQYDGEQTRYQASASVLQVEKDGEEDKRKTELETQANRGISARSYVLLNATYVADRYGPYFHDFMLATGLGHQWWQSDTLSLSTEVGPGYRYQRPNLDEIDDDDLIMPYSVREPVIRAQAKGEWQLVDSVRLEGRSIVISGASNTSVEGAVTLASTITEKLSIKITSKHNYMTDVPPGLKNHDSVLTLGLRYQWL